MLLSPHRASTHCDGCRWGPCAPAARLDCFWHDCDVKRRRMRDDLGLNGPSEAMMRKADLIALEGGVTVIEQSERVCYGVVVGEHGTYFAMVGGVGEFCTCPTPPWQTCSHREALRTIWKRRQENAATE